MKLAQNKSGDGAVARERKPRRVAQARCPLRYGEPCTLCQPGAHGPEDCQTVAMVRADPELRELMAEMNREHRAGT